MSQDLEVDSPSRLPRSISHSKTRDRTVDKGEKKRKRKHQDDPQDPSPTQKHRRSKPSPDTPAAVKTPTIPSIPRDSAAGTAFHSQTSSLYLPLSPISQSHPLQGLCAEYLSPLILTYYPPFQGVILSYSNVRLSSTPITTNEREEVLARSIDEYAAAFIWVTADFLLFKPERGNILEGWINLQNQGNIGLVCLNFFNISIERKRLPKEWRWVSGKLGRSRTSAKGKLNDGEWNDRAKERETRTNGSSDVEGRYVNASGNPVEELIRFRVKDIETSRSADRENGFLSIAGTMLSQEDEQKLMRQEAMMSRSIEARRSGQPREPEHASLVAFVNGADEKDEDGQIARKSKSKHKRA